MVGVVNLLTFFHIFSSSPPVAEYALVVTTCFDSLLSGAGLGHLVKGVDCSCHHYYEDYLAHRLFYPS